MPESDLPAGPWTGFYNYGDGTGRHRMDLVLSFANGAISGDGIDDIGPFLISGHYDGKGGEYHWTKSYIGAHDVFYRGYHEGKGIWGLWELEYFSGGCVELDQIYHQNADRPLDCTYTFPLPAGAAVYRCEVHINGRGIRAWVSPT